MSRKMKVYKAESQIYILRRALYMLRINGNFCYDEIINKVGLETVTFIDIKQATIVVYDLYQNEDREDLLRIPYEDELIPENEILGAYIDDRELQIPLRMSARAYLRENGYYYDFLEYKIEVLVKALSDWLVDHQIEMNLTAY